MNMLSIYLFAFMLCGVLSENINCQFKPGCDVIHCDPSPSSWNKPGFNLDNYLQKKQFPITCEAQKKKSSDDVLRLYADNADNRQEIKDLKQDVRNLVQKVSVLEKKNNNAENGAVTDIQNLVKKFSALKEKNEKAEKDVQNLVQKVSILEEKYNNEIEKLQRKLDLIEAADTTTSETVTTRGIVTTSEATTPRTNPDNCDVKYNSKCFRAIVHSALDTNFNAAQKICNDMGWDVANIYDVTHYRLLGNYLRPMIPSDSTWISLWTGLTYKNNKLYLTSGSQVILVDVWFPGSPFSDASRTNIVVNINKYDGKKYRKGIFNRSPRYSYHGVICEI